MWQPAAALRLSDQQRSSLQQWVRSRNSPQKIVLRASIVLHCAEGLANNAIAEKLHTNRKTVILWRGRFAAAGLEGLRDQSRPGRKPAISPELTQQIVQATLHQQPPAATHWSTRTLAANFGVSKMAVQRIWKAHGLQPHRVETFKLSRDRHFVEKLRDVVGLYLRPPEHALVLSVDEKSQIQALDRSQPGLPMKKGRAGTFTHDYKRHGTTTLFAALNVLDGKVIGQCLARHRHQEFLRFLRQIDRQTPPELDLHLIVDNYSTHKHANVRQWLAKHPRFHFHFTPTSCSWLNLVERWFREITEKRIRRGVFCSVPELIEAIQQYLDTHNAQPKPFVWTASAEGILAKVERAAKANAIVQKR